MSNEAKHAIREREYNHKRYLANGEAILARQRKAYHARVERQRAAQRELEAQREALRQLERIKDLVAALPMGHAAAPVVAA